MFSTINIRPRETKKQLKIASFNLDYKDNYMIFAIDGENLSENEWDETLEKFRTIIREFNQNNND